MLCNSAVFQHFALAFVMYCFCLNVKSLLVCAFILLFVCRNQKNAYLCYIKMKQ